MALADQFALSHDKLGNRVTKVKTETNKALNIA